MTIGKFIQEKRLSKEITLRQFAKLMDMDASNWSKIERDKLPFPKDKLTDLLVHLDLEISTREFWEIEDLIYISHKKIPHYVYQDKEIIGVLPIFFKTAQKGNKPTKEEIEELIKIIRER